LTRQSPLEIVGRTTSQFQGNVGGLLPRAA
jgi:hypothetical protein